MFESFSLIAKVAVVAMVLLLLAIIAIAIYDHKKQLRDMAYLSYDKATKLMDHVHFSRVYNITDIDDSIRHTEPQTAGQMIETITTGSDVRKLLSELGGNIAKNVPNRTIHYIGYEAPSRYDIDDEDGVVSIVEELSSLQDKVRDVLAEGEVIALTVNNKFGDTVTKGNVEFFWKDKGRFYGMSGAPDSQVASYDSFNELLQQEGLFAIDAYEDANYDN